MSREMPSRPRSHTIEDENLRAFTNALPVEWVIRPIGANDYGIDAEVEVFENERATGLFFGVQLRATDKKKGYLRLRFDPPQWNYFLAYGRPVLVVRYHAPDKALYAEWVHRCRPDVNRKSVSVRLRDGHLMTERTPSEIATELRSVSLFQEGARSLPLSVRVTTDADAPRSADQWVVSLAARMGDGNRLKFTSADEPTDTTIHYATSTVLARAGSGHEQVDLTQGTPSSSAADGITALALALASLKLESLAAELLRIAAPFGSLVTDDPMRIGMALAAAPITEVIDVARAVAVHGNGTAATHLVQAPMLIMPAKPSESEVEAVTRFFTSYAEGEFESTQLSRAQASYRLGNFAFDQANLAEALAHYEATLALDTAYENRPYFQKELAAALFEQDRFKESIDWYDRAYASESDIDVLPRLADAHLRSGHYREALDLFARYLDGAETISDSWRLMNEALEFAVGYSGIDRQSRNPELAVTALGETTRSDPPTEAQINEALRQDLLSGPAWECLVSPCFVDRDGDHGRDCSEEMIVNVALVLGVLVEDRHFFAIALVGAAACVGPSLVDPLVRYGIRRHGARWASQMLDTLEGLDPDTLRAIERSIQTAASSDAVHESTLRLHNPDGTWETLIVGHTR